MSLDPIAMWVHMGLAARLVLCVLGALGLAAVAITVERALALASSRRSSLRFAAQLAELLRGGHFERAADAPSDEPLGHLGRVLSAALAVYRSCPRHDAELTFESVARALERQAQREMQRLKRGLGLLATVASIAPFVGLLGTVIGIVDSFVAMAQTGSGGLSVVSAGIAEALITTAVGLVIAIPAMAAYNTLAEWTDACAVDVAEASNELLDLLARHLRSGAEARPSLPALSAAAER